MKVASFTNPEELDGSEFYCNTVQGFTVVKSYMILDSKKIVALTEIRI